MVVTFTRASVSKILGRIVLVLVLASAVLLFTFPYFALRLEPFLAKRLPPPLQSYPDAQALGSVAKRHLTANWLPGRPPTTSDKFHIGSPKLIISWSLDGSARNWGVFGMDEQGRTLHQRVLWQYAIQGSGVKPLGSRVLEKVNQELSNLPVSSSSPPLSDLIIVSYRFSGTWRTKIYSRSSPPPSLQRLVNAIGGELRFANVLRST